MYHWYRTPFKVIVLTDFSSWALLKLFKKFNCYDSENENYDSLGVLKLGRK